LVDICIFGYESCMHWYDKDRFLL